jgi:hypothetical protein
VFRHESRDCPSRCNSYNKRVVAPDTKTGRTDEDDRKKTADSTARRANAPIGAH